MGQLVHVIIRVDFAIIRIEDSFSAFFGSSNLLGFHRQMIQHFCYIGILECTAFFQRNSRTFPVDSFGFSIDVYADVIHNVHPQYEVVQSFIGLCFVVHVGYPSHLFVCT